MDTSKTQSPTATVGVDKNLLQDYAKELQLEASDQIGKDIHAIFVDITREDTKTIPESVFKARFLGKFKAIREDTKGEGNHEAVVREFITYTGSPYAGVDVINSAGEVVVTTPGIYSRANVDLAETGKQGISDKMLTYKEKVAFSPIQANAFIRSVMSASVQTLRTDINTDADQWKQVFDTFDTTKKKVVAAENNNEDEAVFKPKGLGKSLSQLAAEDTDQ